MRTLITFLVFTLFPAYVIAAESHEPASHPAAEAKPVSIKPSLKDPAIEAAKEAVKEAAKDPAKDASTEAARISAAAAKQAALEKEMGAKIAARLAAIRKERAARQHARHKVAAKAVPAHGATATDPAHAAHWSYEGEGGPLRWGKLNPAWNKCDSGDRQSPIDIRDGIKVQLEAVNFDYKPAHFNVIDNGHTVQVNLGAGNYMTVMGRMYELVQFHFHRPSEERVNGRGSAMVAHLVHKDVDGKLAVVAVLMDEGKPHGLVQTVWNNLPLEKNAPVYPSVLMDLNQLLPERRDYFTYMGSLTTPPCSEGVLWIVYKEPIQVSIQQIGIFSRLYQMNARPIQTQSGRLIKESN
jgi:carbonic anhydrase